MSVVALGCLLRDSSLEASDIQQKVLREQDARTNHPIKCAMMGRVDRRAPRNNANTLISGYGAICVNEHLVKCHTSVTIKCRLNVTVCFNQVKTLQYSELL